jgi:hypothetical protein
LQVQGVPAVRVAAGHRQIVRKAKDAKKLAEIVREKHPRWDAERVAAAQKEIFKSKTKLR